MKKTIKTDIARIDCETGDGLSLTIQKQDETRPLVVVIRDAKQFHEVKLNF